MKYRKLANETVSALGFGCMRLPVIGGDMNKIDEPEATRMLHRAIDLGVNYVDTAWPYHGGESEPVTGRALKGKYRDKVFLATKCPTWSVDEWPDFDKYLNEQMRKLQTGHIDFYLMHSLDKERWPIIRNLGAIVFMERALNDGRIGHLGFSFHDDHEFFAPIIDGFKWDFCQIQYNYMDEKNQAGTEGLEYAVSKGVDVIVMEPLRGGKLTKKVPETIQKLMEKSGIERTPAELALRWVWNRADVSCVLSGMSAMDQVEENCRIASDAEANSLSPDELQIIEEIKKLYIERSEIPCTDCRYCVPCPSGVNIPRIFSIFNDMRIYEDEKSARMFYGMFMKPEERANNCTECGECEEKCPQGIKIIEELKKCHEKLSG
ncbi:MAG: aldo/keto reductase [bacterium]|nr:aldo/keto reductase [bacterium]